MLKPNRLKQVWHDVRDWEEVAHNMWGDSTDRKSDLDKAITFTSDHKLYGSYMAKVCEQWPVSCENALTDPNLNQKAWLGHAAVALALNIPEDITRQAWGFLTDEQKHLANKEAERNIDLWKSRYIESRGVRESMGKQMLF